MNKCYKVKWVSDVVTLSYFLAKSLSKCKMLWPLSK